MFGTVAKTTASSVEMNAVAAIVPTRELKNRFPKAKIAAIPRTAKAR